MPLGQSSPFFFSTRSPAPGVVQLWEESTELRIPVQEGGASPGKIPLSSRNGPLRKQGRQEAGASLGSREKTPDSSDLSSVFAHSGSASPGTSRRSWSPSLGSAGCAAPRPPPSCRPGHSTPLSQTPSLNTSAYTYLRSCCSSPEGHQGVLPRGSAQPGDPSGEGEERGWGPDPGQVAPRAPALALRRGE